MPAILPQIIGIISLPPPVKDAPMTSANSTAHDALHQPFGMGEDDMPRRDLPDLSGLEGDAWIQAIDSLGEAHGDFDRLGASHYKLFLDFGRTLLVTFESIAETQQLPDARPRGIALAMARNWSLLSFLSDGETWFRDRSIWGTIDRLTDDGFFEDFDRVLFFGIGVGGYAASAFSVASPGARVLALRPQATLTPAIAGWDKRFPNARRIDFTSRYGYGPDMIDAADHADILVDPTVPQDMIHAALYTRSNVTVHRVPHAGLRLEDTCDKLGITSRLIEAAMHGQLTPDYFGTLWRARRKHTPYLRLLLRKAETAGRISFIRKVCRHGMATRDRAFFLRKLDELAPRPWPAKPEAPVRDKLE